MGPDNINNMCLKKGGEPIIESLKILFNIMIENGWSPQVWNEEWTVLIHKGKSRLELDNYRGITVSSCVGKVLTKIMAARLREMAEEQKWLPEARAAFRKGRCVEDHLFVVRALVDRAKVQKEHLYGAFLDLRKAYDSVDRETLWKKLEAIGPDRQSTDFLRNLYRNNTKRIRVGNEITNTIEVTKGVRQGCPLSSILFALFINRVPGKAAERQVSRAQN